MGPIISYTTSDAYKALQKHVPSTIYLLRDTGEIYVGDILLSKCTSVVTVDSVPEAPVAGRFYYVYVPAQGEEGQEGYVPASEDLIFFDDELNQHRVVDIVAQIIDHSVFVTYDAFNPILETLATKEELGTVSDKVDDVEQNIPYAVSEGISDAKGGIIGEASAQSFDDLFVKVKAAGYNGTKNTFISGISTLLNHLDDIVIAEGQDVVPAIDGSDETSLAAALNALEAGAPVNVVANAVLDGNVSLDGVTFNGNDKLIKTEGNTFTVAGTSSIENTNFADNSDIADPANAKTMFEIPAGATATIKDTDIDSSTCRVLNITGSAVLEGVDINSSLDGAYAAAKYDSKPVIITNKNANITIKDGSIVANTSDASDCGLYGIYSVGGGNIVLGDPETHNGPTIITNSAPIGTNNLDGGIDNITIYGGVYKSLMSHTGFMGVMYLGAGAVVNIYDGTFDGGEYDIALPYRPAKYIVNIYGGTFNGSIKTINKDFKTGGGGTDPDNDQDEIKIYGGNFAVEVPAEYLAEGYQCLPQGNRWVVLPIPVTEPEEPVEP